MKSPTVILHTNNPEASHEVFSKNHPDLPILTCDSYGELPEMLEESGAEVVYTIRFDGTQNYPRQALLESKTVKWVSVGGSGTDHLNPWDPEALTVTNAAGVAAEMMAQYVLGAMLHFSLGLPQLGVAQRRRQWFSAQVESLNGKTVLIIGLGKTGQAVANLCKLLELKTIGVRARPEPTPNVDEVHAVEALPKLWFCADFIVCCVPLLDSTRCIVGAEAFSAMKPSAVLIDVSRGGVVREYALIKALNEKRIRGAALDVFDTEPLPPENPLWNFENVLISPHCSAVYQGWELKSVEMFSENLTRYRKGLALTNIVNPERGY